jgi:hypothetical protein
MVQPGEDRHGEATKVYLLYTGMVGTPHMKARKTGRYTGKIYHGVKQQVLVIPSNLIPASRPVYGTFAIELGD